MSESADVAKSQCRKKVRLTDIVALFTPVILAASMWFPEWSRPAPRRGCGALNESCRSSNRGAVFALSIRHFSSAAMQACFKRQWRRRDGQQRVAPVHFPGRATATARPKIGLLGRTKNILSRASWSKSSPFGGSSPPANALPFSQPMTTVSIPRIRAGTT